MEQECKIAAESKRRRESEENKDAEQLLRVRRDKKSCSLYYSSLFLL